MLYAQVGIVCGDNKGGHAMSGVEMGVFFFAQFQPSAPCMQSGHVHVFSFKSLHLTLCARVLITGAESSLLMAPQRDFCLSKVCVCLKDNDPVRRYLRIYGAQTSLGCTRVAPFVSASCALVGFQRSVVRTQVLFAATVQCSFGYDRALHS